MLLLEQLERERLVVEIRNLATIDADERVHRAARRNEVQVATLRDSVDDRLPGLVESPARRAQLRDALEAPERGLHGPLPGHVAAEAKRREQIHSGEERLRGLERAAKPRPAYAVRPP